MCSAVYIWDVKRNGLGDESDVILRCVCVVEEGHEK